MFNFVDMKQTNEHNVSVLFCRILLLTLCVMTAWETNAADNSVEKHNRELVDSIEHYLKLYPEARGRRLAFVDSLKHQRDHADNPADRVALGMKLGRIYLAENVDSALIYWRLSRKEAIDARLDNEARQLEMFLYSALPRIGVSIEALDNFGKIDHANLSDELQRMYYLCAAELYFNLQRPYPSGEYKDRYRKLTIEALDSLPNFYPAGSPVMAFVNAQIHNLKGEYNLAAANFMEILPSLKSRPILYDLALGYVADFYEKRPPHKSLYLNYLYKRTVFELKSGIVRPEVLAKAGRMLVNDGRTSLGKDLITLAMNTKDVRNYAFTNFDRTDYAQYLNKTSETARMWGIIIIVLLVGLVICALLYIRHIKETEHETQMQMAANEDKYRVSSADMVKISSSVLSMALLSDEQLKEYNLYVIRKLKAGQVKDLFQEVQSGEYIRQLNEKFFLSFDDTFMATFPGFVDDLNKLFEQGKELSLLPGRRLSPELRIAAFLRLGVTDSNKLAQVLGLSINTIYTYRNRLKGRAINRETFENDVRQIGFGA